MSNSGEDAADSPGEATRRRSRKSQKSPNGPPLKVDLGGRFAVVGMGASAGGLEALEEFFQKMPADGGMAFVVVQHLDPTHDDMLAELLQRNTTMPVRRVQDGMTVEPAPPPARSVCPRRWPPCRGCRRRWPAPPRGACRSRAGSGSGRRSRECRRSAGRGSSPTASRSAGRPAARACASNRRAAGPRRSGDSRRRCGSPRGRSTAG